MEITVLGSGTGAPSLKRVASGLILKINKENLLFDSGPAIVRRLLEIGVTYHDINYIFYSHFHTDHTLDLAAILFAAKYALSLRIKPLNILGPQGLVKFYQALLNLYGDVIGPEAYQINLKEIGEENLEFGQYEVKTMRMQHTPESLGYRIEANNKVVVYSGDTDVCENIVKLGQNADVLILDCSFPDELKLGGHLSASEAGQIAQACRCKKLVLSHLYPVCDEETITKQAKRIFRGEVIVAYDLMRLTV